MTNKKTGLSIAGQSFESLKKVNAHGAEYWSARSLQPLLGYSQWRRFEQAVERAISSCKQSGNPPGHHFAGAGKPIPGGKGAVQIVNDYHLSRFACLPLAQNGDPRKPEIANAQKYFAIQTRRQELSDQAAADHVGANNYSPLQRLGRDAIKQRKAIPDKDNLLDRMNATELAANQFRMTQTTENVMS